MGRNKNKKGCAPLSVAGQVAAPNAERMTICFVVCDCKQSPQVLLDGKDLVVATMARLAGPATRNADGMETSMWTRE